jgi:lactate permease
MTALAAVPFVVFFVLLFWKKTKLLTSSFVALVVTLLLVIFAWRMNTGFVVASLAKGTFIAFDIFLIVFGAIFFLDTLKSAKIISSLCAYLEAFSKDYRIQVILLAWFLENFLEGTAGFGSASTVVAPLLVAIGMAPILAASVSLLGNSTSVAFGAAGTPIRTGYAGLDITGVPELTATINLIGFIIPAFMLWLASSGQPERKRDFLEALPFALFAGFAFVVPSLAVVGLGQEFPSIIGSVAGLLITLAAIKIRLFVPANVRSLANRDVSLEKLPLKKVIFPYLLMIVLLIAGKFVLSGFGIPVKFGLSHTFSLFNPGLIFIVSALPVALSLSHGRNSLFPSLWSAIKRSRETFLVIAFMTAMVQLMIYSGQNSTGYISILNFLAQIFITPLLPFLASVAGAFGTFLTGSATISNIMMGNLLNDAAGIVGISSALILSLGLAGAAAGNIISIADIMPALAVLNIKNEERSVLKKVIIPCLIYVILVGIIGLAISHFLRL